MRAPAAAVDGRWRGRSWWRPLRFRPGAPARRDPLLARRAALTLVRADADRLEVWTLADTAAYVRTSDGAVSCIGLASGMPGARERSGSQTASSDRCKFFGDRANVRFWEWLQEQRRLLNAPDGLAVFGLEPDAADRLDHAVVTCRGLAHILLASDGFSALVELYKHMETTALIDAALASGLEPLARELRRIETEIDPDGALPAFQAERRCDGSAVAKSAMTHYINGNAQATKNLKFYRFDSHRTAVTSISLNARNRIRRRAGPS